MTDADRIQFGVQLLEMHASLTQAVEKAGGSSSAICTLPALRNTSAFELMCLLASNGVRFTHEGTA